jgi:hypothetical protein
MPLSSSQAQAGFLLHRVFAVKYFFSVITLLVSHSLLIDISFGLLSMVKLDRVGLLTIQTRAIRSRYRIVAPSNTGVRTFIPSIGLPSLEGFQNLADIHTEGTPMD